MISFPEEEKLIVSTPQKLIVFETLTFKVIQTLEIQNLKVLQNINKNKNDLKNRANRIYSFFASKGGSYASIHLFSINFNDYTVFTKEIIHKHMPKYCFLNFFELSCNLIVIAFNKGTEVTQALWQAVMGSNPSHFKFPDRPVEEISWNDCKTFIEKLNQLTDKHFRLPTEAEWEYAARGGGNSHGYKFSGSDNVDDVAWYTDNCGGETHAVKTKAANELGLYDMTGNVLEWCSDWMAAYTADTVSNPQGPAAGFKRVLRGGSLYNDARRLRVTRRSEYNPTFTDYSVGFRLAL